MGEILCLSDIHATHRPPSSCTDAYWPDLRDLLWQSAALAGQREVRAAAWAGDVLHHKAPAKTGYSVILDLIRVIKAHPCPVVIAAGNHDLQHDRIDSIDTTQPLGVLYQAGALRLDGWAEGLPVYGVPWLQDWSAAGVAAALQDWRDWTPFESAGPCHLVVTHAPVYPPDKVPRYDGAEVTPASWWADAMGHEGCVFYGHVHEPHGVWQYEGVTFCNNGALSRGSLDEYNLERPVGVTLWDDQSGVFTFAPLSARPASEVFRLAEHERAVTSHAVLAGFLEEVGSARLGVLSIEGVITHIKTLGLGAEIEDLAAELLTDAAYGGRR
jgi:Calcineurin-like phosphoesterase